MVSAAKLPRLQIPPLLAILENRFLSALILPMLHSTIAMPATKEDRKACSFSSSSSCMDSAFVAYQLTKRNWRVSEDYLH